MSKKNGEKSKTVSKLGSGLKEFGRKIVVSLKRRPHIIPGVVMAAAFLVYSLNLTDVSNTTAKIQGQGMGLCGFCTMLFSMLSFVCFLNAFPHRKKVNIPMLLLMFVMFAVIIYCDVHYMGRVMTAITRAENPIQITANTAYIADAYNILNVHIVILAAAAVLIVLLPIYSRLIRKINTSIDVEDNGSLAEIELSDEE